MAPGKTEKKRKAPAVSDPPAKKTKKVEAKPAEAPKESAPKSILKKKETATKKAKETKSDAPAKVNGQTKPRKRAADFLSDAEDKETAAPASAVQKKSVNKKAKKEEKPAVPEKKTKASPKAKKVEEVAIESEDDEAEDISAESDESEGEDILDDQTAALIKGFESSGDEDDSEDEGFDSNKPVPKIPDTKKAAKKIKSLTKNEVPETPGAVYVGRIPHGFYEHQMRAYFSQFGEITRLRLSRNRITGRSKHYAFVEFSSVTVAKIVAETMDNYLMYGHILKCKYVPQESLHPEVWKGANRRFKRTPWNRIEKKRLEKGKTREQWTKRIEQEQKRRQAKIDKLKALGYSIDLPELKSVDDVPIQEPKEIEAAAETTEAPKEEAVKAIEAVEAAPAPAAVSEDTPKKAKKGKKAAEKVENVEKTEAPKEKATTTASPAPKKKAKKTKSKA
ncbi:Nucleotide-binding alpha-beta plait [Penicillium malachiteum]|uniref:Nucleotide-binding alpha-beta plait n=1 Tax=Penicillium malachiteum TaxID=1324776 RepID=UPI002547B2B2|nr:Nucleotide-binding alpha-beta plait [Penicillium malachiteum]KAJ5714966.1 Nucleotide-binding alpha-beta plait [Penicillium malachiteum]